MPTEPTANLGMSVLGEAQLPHRFNTDTITKMEVATVTRLETVEPLGPAGEWQPPADPYFQDAYYVQSGEVGTAWEGLSEVVAYWTGGSWATISLRTGWNAYDISDAVNKTYRYDQSAGAGAWVEFNEILAVTRTFSRLYRRDSRSTAGVLDRFTIINFGPTYLSSVGLLRGTTLFDQAFFTQYNGSAMTTFHPAIAPECDMPNTYPLYRYAGNVNRAGDPRSSTPRVLGGLITIAANTSQIRYSAGFKLVLVQAADAEAEPLELENCRLNVADDAVPVNNEDMAVNFGNNNLSPWTPGGFYGKNHVQVLATFDGISEDPGSGSDYDFVKSYVVPPSTLAGMPAGVVTLVDTTPVSAGNPFGPTADGGTEWGSANVSVQLTLENTF